MAGDDVRLTDGQISLDDVEVGAADPAGVNPDENFSRTGLRGGDIFPDQRGRFRRGGSSEDTGVHGSIATSFYAGLEA
jgi:hypothetical protein